MDKVYGESAPTYRTVARWVNLVRAGMQNIQDEVNICVRKRCAVETLVEEYAGYTTEKIHMQSNFNG